MEWGSVVAENKRLKDRIKELEEALATTEAAYRREKERADAIDTLYRQSRAKCEQLQTELRREKDRADDLEEELRAWIEAGE